MKKPIDVAIEFARGQGNAVSPRNERVQAIFQALVERGIDVVRVPYVSRVRIGEHLTDSVALGEVLGIEPWLAMNLADAYHYVSGREYTWIEVAELLEKARDHVES